MRYPENCEVAENHAKKAMVHMTKRGIPWNPHNYTIWYEYVAGTNAELNRRIDEIIDSDDGFSNSQNEGLYKEFFETTDLATQTHQWSEKIEVVANQIMVAIANVASGTETYGDALKAFSGKIESATSIDDLKTMIGSVLSETNFMDEHITALQSKVKDASREIMALKQNLEIARRDARTDNLTGIANRKCFDETLDRAIDLAREEGEPLSLIFADLDHFKQFNDNHGHQVGDQVLRVVGNTLLKCVKGQDTPSRFGGEEFAVILPNTSIGGACTLAESLRIAVESKKLVRKGTGKEIGSISISIGVAEYRPGEPASDFIQRADSAVYKAKEMGRNQVACETALEESVAPMAVKAALG